MIVGLEKHPIVDKCMEIAVRKTVLDKLRLFNIYHINRFFFVNIRKQSKSDLFYLQPAKIQKFRNGKSLATNIYNESFLPDTLIINLLQKQQSIPLGFIKISVAIRLGFVKNHTIIRLGFIKIYYFCRRNG